ncbi:TRAP transporter small permease [Aestuariibius sp. HNIBRBA575]|uniref:TRAP transporter small permease n=1 Tax=Aestuariibius sp. HNIBRBA575 TaxID=3233343 RepID=UPI0034A4B842
MSAAKARGPQGKFARLISNIEETFIALLLGLMVLVTFVNVVLRYTNGTWINTTLETLLGVDFPPSLLWGLETVLVLFAWLVLFGISYGFKVTAHLGVDAILNIVAAPVRKTLVLISALCCIAYGGLMMKGAWDYWAPFAGYKKTEGRIIPTGFDDRTRDQAWYETEQIPIPFGQEFLENRYNLGEEYEKMPRFIPYAILPFGIALMLFRILQATVAILRGRADSLIVSHEAEDAVEEVSALNKEN